MEPARSSYQGLNCRHYRHNVLGFASLYSGNLHQQATKASYVMPMIDFSESTASERGAAEYLVAYLLGQRTI